jgi:hypothetical protein
VSPVQLERDGRQPASEPAMPLGVSVPVGSVVVVATVFACAGIPLRDSGLRYGLLAAVSCGFALAVGAWVPALLVAGIGFLLADGFLVGSFGELAWHGQADLWRAGTLVVAAAAGLGVAQIWRHWVVLRALWKLEFFANRPPHPARTGVFIHVPGPQRRARELVAVHERVHERE